MKAAVLFLSPKVLSHRTFFLQGIQLHVEGGAGKSVSVPSRLYNQNTLVAIFFPHILTVTLLSSLSHCCYYCRKENFQHNSVALRVIYILCLILLRFVLGFCSFAKIFQIIFKSPYLGFTGPCDSVSEDLQSVLENSQTFFFLTYCINFILSLSFPTKILIRHMLKLLALFGISHNPILNLFFFVQ